MTVGAKFYAMRDSLVGNWLLSETLIDDQLEDITVTFISSAG